MRNYALYKSMLPAEVLQNSILLSFNCVHLELTSHMCLVQTWPFGGWPLTSSLVRRSGLLCGGLAFRSVVTLGASVNSSCDRLMLCMLPTVLLQLAHWTYSSARCILGKFRPIKWIADFPTTHHQIIRIAIHQNSSREAPGILEDSCDVV